MASNPTTKSVVPEVKAVYQEVSLIAREVHIKLGGEEPNGDSEYYVVEGDPDVTECVEATDMVVTQTQCRFQHPMQSNEIRFVLAPDVRLANDIRLRVRASVQK